MVFKCASDTIFLDDFKSVLDNIVEGALERAGGSGRHPRSGRRKSSLAGAKRNGSASDPASNYKPGPVITTISCNRERERERSGSALGAHRMTELPRTVNWSDAAKEAAAADHRRLPKLQIQQETTVETVSEGRKGEASRNNSGSTLAPRQGRSSSAAGRGRKLSVDQWGDIIGDDEDDETTEGSNRSSGGLLPLQRPEKTADRPSRAELP